MKRDARQEGLRWLEQAEADRYGAELLFDGASYHPRYPNGLLDSIPARVYTQASAEDALRLADQTLRLVQTKVRTQSPGNGD